MERYNARPMFKDWDDEGPDLDRTSASAIEVLRGQLPQQGVQVYARWQGVNADHPTAWEKTEHPLAWADGFMQQRGPGAVMWLGRGKDPSAFAALRIVRWNVQAIDNATTDIEVIVAALRHHFPDHKNYGIYHREVIPGNGWSQHSWGNAYDAGASADLVVKMGEWSVRMAKEHLLPTCHVIYDHVSRWERDGWLPVHYSADDHVGHLHIEGSHYFEGTPPQDPPW